MRKVYLDKNVGQFGMYVVYDGWKNGRRVNPRGTYNREIAAAEIRRRRVSVRVVEV